MASRFETVAAVNSVANISGIPSSYDQKQHAGMFVYDPAGSGKRVVAFYKTGSSVQRMMDGQRRLVSGLRQSGPRLHGARYRVRHRRLAQAGIFVESMESGGAPSSAWQRPHARKAKTGSSAPAHKAATAANDKPFKDRTKRSRRYSRVIRFTSPKASTTASSRPVTGRSRPRTLR